MKKYMVLILCLLCITILISGCNGIYSSSEETEKTECVTTETGKIEETEMADEFPESYDYMGTVESYVDIMTTPTEPNQANFETCVGKTYYVLGDYLYIQIDKDIEVYIRIHSD